MTFNEWKSEVLRRFPAAQILDECDGATARFADADCGWWLASSCDNKDPDGWIAKAE